MPTVASLRTLVQYELPSCPSLTVDAAIVDSCRAFARDTWAMMVRMNESSAVGVPNYDLFAGAGEEVIAVTAVTLDGAIALQPMTPEARLIDISSAGDPTHFWFADGQLWVYPTPNKLGSLAITAATMPTRAATSVDDRYSTYSEAIRAHALFRLMRMPNSTWSDPLTAQANYRMYRAEAANTLRGLMHGRSAAPGRVQANFF